MHPLNIYSYHVRYGHSDHKQKHYKITEAVCFAPLFNSGCKSKYYRIIIVKGDADLKHYRSNYCFLNKQEIKNHFRQLPKFCPMKFNVTEVKYDKTDAYQIDLFIDSDNRLIHKYVLTWTRTLFEWPYNMFLLHAKELHKMPEFRFESVINLFNAVATSHSHAFVGRGHGFGVNLLPKKKKAIATTVNDEKVQRYGGRVNDVFSQCTDFMDNPQCELPQNFEQITPELFENNRGMYIQTYFMLKDYENKHHRK